MSGGVDSSVCALLLKNEGYEVIGLFMRNWDSVVNKDILGNPNVNNICPQEQDYLDALNVCEKLNIPLHRVDFVKEYWDYVWTYFLDELKKGRTPNPDIMCNKYIKFDAFIKEAKRLGADYVATGHYAIIEDNRLYKATDLNKDQTYFLSQLTKFQLENVMFPLGKLCKSEVRDIARTYNLEVFNKKDSTGICFIGERNFSQFLKNYLPTKNGNIVNIETKEILGKHDGLMYYTIGQRKGLNIGGNESRLFVVGKDLKDNILYVAKEDSKYLYSDSALIEDVNWINKPLKNELWAKFRYRQRDIKVKIKYLNEFVLVEFAELVKAVTPGQACVFYDGAECLGGGFIKDVYLEGKKHI